MKLSEKIQYLRKEHGLTQEQLAEQCNVSRQAITKWESDIAIPETEKIIFLSKLFKVSIDELLKDELDIIGVKAVSSCGKSLVIDTEILRQYFINHPQSIDKYTFLQNSAFTHWVKEKCSKMC